MNRGKQIFEENEYEITGNPAVDTVTACVSYHRKHFVKLKTITLRQDFYDMFKAYFESKGEVGNVEGFEIDGVNIDRATTELDQNMVLDIQK